MEKTINVVLLDNDEVVTSSIKKYFCSDAVIKIIGSFKNGKEGLDFLLKNHFHYDVIVLDILLPEIDGLKILEELKEKRIYKKSIIISGYKDDYSIKTAQMLGANYYMLKPLDMESLKTRIIEVAKTNLMDTYKRTNNLELELSTILHNLGIPSHVKGYSYIREGILMLYECNSVATLVTKDVYPEIASRYETTTSRVERAIRHAIEISWLRGDLKLMEKIFGNSIDFERSKPTNSEFLTTIADRLKLNAKNKLSVLQ